MISDKSDVKNILTNQIHEVFESIGGCSFDVLAFDKSSNKLIVSFDLHVVPEDDYIGFSSY